MIGYLVRSLARSLAFTAIETTPSCRNPFFMNVDIHAGIPHAHSNFFVL